MAFSKISAIPSTLTTSAIRPKTETETSQCLSPCLCEDVDCECGSTQLANSGQHSSRVCAEFELDVRTAASSVYQDSLAVGAALHTSLWDGNLGPTIQTKRLWDSTPPQSCSTTAVKQLSKMQRSELRLWSACWWNAILWVHQHAITAMACRWQHGLSRRN